MVTSICLHYSTQHEFDDISLYDDGITRIMEMTGDYYTDAYALRIALDFIEGNLKPEEAEKMVKQIDGREWPLARRLLSIPQKRVMYHQHHMGVKSF